MHVFVRICLRSKILSICIFYDKKYCINFVLIQCYELKNINDIFLYKLFVKNNRNEHNKYPDKHIHSYPIHVHV